MLQMGGEKMAKSVGNIALLPDALEDWGRDALMLFFAAGHYRQPMRLRRRARCAEARGQRARASARPARRLVAGPVAARTWRRCATRFFAALADDFNTPAALAALFDWVREANRARRRRRATRTCARCSASSALDEPARRRRRGRARREVARAARARAQAARAPRDFAEADRLRDELARAGWQVRDARRRPELVAARA